MRETIQGSPITRLLRLLSILALPIMMAAAQGGSEDSVRVLFRVSGSSGTTHFVPGEFNNWGPNIAGNIAPAAASQMTYDDTLGAWIKFYTLKIHDLTDSRRTLGDSIFMYKFNAGGTTSGWFSDPLNPEKNLSDNSNSVLRLTRRFWFQFSAQANNGVISRVTAGLVHSLTDSITSILLQHGPDKNGPVSTNDVTSGYDPAKPIVDHTFAVPIDETDYIRLVAFTSMGDSIVFDRGGYQVLIAPMPADIRHGVTLPNDPASDSVGFRIMAPVGNLVMLRIAPAGSPAALADPIVMNKNVSSADWWVYVRLQPGTYDYLFEIDGERYVQDPWGRQQSSGGSRFTKGPQGLSADDYVWASNSYVRPPQKDLIIYELHVGEYAGGFYGRVGTFQDMITLLPHLDSLGINAIELMPVTDYGLLGPSGFSWGYDISSYYALEPSYGTAADYKELIDSAHARGMAVIMDVVYNHLNDPSPLWQLLPDVTLNPYFKNPGGAYNEDGLTFFRDLDHWNGFTQAHVYESLKMWIDEFRIDGFRYDYTQGIGWDVNRPTLGILGWANRIETEYGGQIYQIAEHLPESPALTYFSGITGGWHDSFRDRVFDEARFQNQNLALLEDQVLDLGAFQGNDTPSFPDRYADRSEPVNYTVSHDEQSLVYEMSQFQSVPLDVALKRDKLYAVFAFTSLGVPMIWQGQETGESRGWTSEGEKLSFRPVDWTRLGTMAGREHWEHYRSLIMQRRFNPALNKGLLRKLYRYDTGGQKVLVWGLEDTLNGTAVMVVANLGGSVQTITNVPWLSPGEWYDVFTQSSISVAGNSITSMDIPDYTARVYSNQSDSSLNIPTSVTGPVEDLLPASLVLHQNYPNPFNPSTTIRYELPEDGDVRLTIYNSLGQELVDILHQYQRQGTHSVTWNPQHDLSSGLYFIRLRSGSAMLTRKLLYLR